MFMLIVIVSFAPFQEGEVTRVYPTRNACKKVELKAEKDPTMKIKQHCSRIV